MSNVPNPISDDEALRTVVAAGRLPFEQRDAVLKNVLQRLDTAGRRRVGEALDANKDRVIANLGGAGLLLDWEAALSTTRSAAVERPWREPQTRRRAEERLAEAVKVDQDDDTVERRVLVEVGGERLASASGRLNAVWQDVDHDLKGAKDALKKAEAHHQATIAAILESPDYKAALDDAIATRNKARVERERLSDWLKQYQSETEAMFGVGGARRPDTPDATPANGAHLVSGGYDEF